MYKVLVVESKQTDGSSLAGTVPACSIPELFDILHAQQNSLSARQNMNTLAVYSGGFPQEPCRSVLAIVPHMHSTSSPYAAGCGGLHLPAKAATDHDSGFIARPDNCNNHANWTPPAYQVSVHGLQRRAPAYELLLRKAGQQVFESIPRKVAMSNDESYGHIDAGYGVEMGALTG